MRWPIELVLSLHMVLTSGIPAEATQNLELSWTSNST